MHQLALYTGCLDNSRTYNSPAKDGHGHYDISTSMHAPHVISSGVHKAKAEEYTTPHIGIVVKIGGGGLPRN